MNERTKLIIAVIVGMAIGVGFVSVLQMARSSFLGGFDNTFGDQWLKTSVAMVELHRVRYGRYPESLRDVKFTGAWDPMAIDSMSYNVNDAGTRYCLEVRRGFTAKPKIEMPPEFWQNTGYDPALCR